MNSEQGPVATGYICDGCRTRVGINERVLCPRCGQPKNGVRHCAR